MRWGVRDESTDDHATAAICLEELRQCQRTSVGPNFVYFAGQKYGYRPLPNVIGGEVCMALLNYSQGVQKGTSKEMFGFLYH